MANGRGIVAVAIVGWLLAGLATGLLIGFLVGRSTAPTVTDNAVNIPAPTRDVAQLPELPSPTPPLVEALPSPTPQTSESDPSPTQPLPTGVPPTAPPAFVGTVDDSDAFIGIAQNDNELLVYVCDGSQGQETIAQWFKGDVTDGNSFELASEEGARLIGTLNGEEAEGTVRLPDGRERRFKANLARGDGGLSRVEDEIEGTARVRGWIFMPDGRFRGDGFPTHCSCNAATGNVYCPAAGSEGQYFTWCQNCCP